MRIRTINLLAVALLALGLCAAPFTSHAQGTQAGREPGKNIVFAGPGGGLGDLLKELFSKFTAQSGIRVTYMLGTLQDLYGRMKVEQQRPSIDIYYSSPITEIRGMEEGLYAPLDPAIVTNLSKLYDVARLPKNLGVRIELTDVGILYNKKIYDEKKIPHPRTWADIWHPAVAGHVILGDTSSFYTVSYIAFLNKMMGGKEDDPTPAIKHIASQKQKLLAIVRTYPERIQFLTTGQAWLTVDGGETSLPEIEKNPDLGFISPKEGAPLFWHSLHVVKGASNPIGAQLLINFMISEEVQAEFAKKGFMGPVNKAVKLAPEMARMVPYGPEGVARLTELNNLAISQSLEKYRQEWAARVVGDKK